MTSVDIRGPLCRECGSSEQTCARDAGCCDLCTHWLGYTDSGELLDVLVPERKRLLPVSIHGSDRGYWQHRARHELPCPACRMAHARAKGLIPA